MGHVGLLKNDRISPTKNTSLNDCRPVLRNTQMTCGPKRRYSEIKLDSGFRIML